MSESGARRTTGPRRVVTGHDDSGRSVVIEDRLSPNVTYRTETGGILSTLVWVTDGAPADISGREDAADRKMGVPPPAMGTAFRVIEFPPFDPALENKPNDEIQRDWGMQNSALLGHPPRHPFIHRTKTIDYIVVLEGEIDMLLDDGEVHLEAGDTLIQRGTNHAWINRGTKPCRVAIIFIDSKEPEEVARHHANT